MSEIKNLEIPKNQFERSPRPEQGQESAPQPEKRPEYAAEQAEKISAGHSAQNQTLAVDALDSGQSLVDDSGLRLQRVETILAQDMDQVFLTMDANTQLIFKQRGEETAIKINNLFKKTKVKFNEVLNLIIEWLKIIPKVNKHYLEQEAKIKTDAIIKLHSQK